MTRWLVTGARGQLGTQLVDLLGDDAVGLSRAELDITDSDAVAQAVETHRPDVVVNTAAYTAVDAAETDEAAATAINATAVGFLAAAARAAHARFVQVSTDYVFGGDADAPYEVDDPTGPRTAYGRTKLAGERAAIERNPDAYVVRTAWVFGGPSANFVDTMRRLEGERDFVDVVADQTGSPTYAGDLAQGIVELGASDAAPGVLHYVNSGTATWLDLARAVFAGVGADPARARPTTSDKFVRPAPRPAWSVLSTRSWIEQGLTGPRPWRDALADCLNR